jgi:hypothetical protein
MDSPRPRSPATSTPKSSRKRTSSVVRPVQAKRPRTDYRQVHSSRDKKKREKKKQPKTRDSSGLARNECTSPLDPDLPCPSDSASSSIENCQSFVSAQSGALFGGSSTAPSRVHSKPVRTPLPASPRQDHVLPTLHDENKVRLQSYMLLMAYKLFIIVSPRA